jgi:hypothetical protein
MKKCVIITFFFAILASGIIYKFYNESARTKPDFLDIDEKNISNRVGSKQELYTFSVYPDESRDSSISWEQDLTHIGRKLLKISFRGDFIRYYKGLGLSMTLSLTDIWKRGAIEVWLKANNRTSAITYLEILFKEERGYGHCVKAALPVTSNKGWKKFIVPLREFKLVALNNGDGDRFSWEIGEILFSIPPFSSQSPATLLIRNFKIIHEDRIITLF